MELNDKDLCKAVSEVERGLVDADLGGGVVKQRLARRGQGKSGGFRVVILYRRGARSFFAYCFAKNQRANIAQDELAALKELAAELLAYDDVQIAKAIASGVLIEVICHDQG